MKNITRRHALTLAGTAAIAGFLPTTAAVAQTVEELMAPTQLEEMVLGKEDAPVTIIEYASMTCGHCAAFHRDTYPGLKEKYIDTGKARLVLREFPFDPRAMAGFMLMRCAPNNAYFQMADVLFKQQSAWARAQDPIPPLRNIAKLAGFSEESFTACLQNQELLDKILEVQKRGSEEFKVDSTPTFFVNGKKYTGNISLEEFSKIIDENLPS